MRKKIGKKARKCQLRIPKRTILTGYLFKTARVLSFDFIASDYRVMPLRCLSSDTSIQSFDLCNEEWLSLQDENRARQHLRIPCCRSTVNLKTSPRGIRFFAHKAKGECATAPESEAHIHLNQRAVAIARARGWSASTEVAGLAPTVKRGGRTCMPRRATIKSRSEVRWSGQVPEETMRRQERYRHSGIRGVWLLRQPGFPVNRELPAICIGGGLEQGLTALVPSEGYYSAHDRKSVSSWHQVETMEAFLEALFERRFLFGIPDRAIATVSVHAATWDCWSCGAESRIIPSVEISVGPLQ
jgi:competence protein CoiA